MILMPSISAIAVPERGKLMGAATKRFVLLSWTCVIILIITGIVKALSPGMAEATPSEQVGMFIKYALFAGMVLGGILITFVLGPKMKKLTPSPGFARVQKQIATLAFVNMILAIM